MGDDTRGMHHHDMEHMSHADHDHLDMPAMAEHGGQAPFPSPDRAHHMDHMEHAGHAGRMDHMGHMGNLGFKFAISLVLALPILALSPMMGLRLPFQFAFPGSDWVVLALASILFFHGGMPFLSGAKQELRRRAPAMMTLISLGISVAYLYSLYAFAVNHLFPDRHVMDFFWELATLIVIMLLGHWIEMRAVGAAGDALQKMAALLPGSAAVVRDNGDVEEVPLRDVAVGDRVMVKAGDKVPADGEVTEGSTTVNESLITGEAREVAKAAGDRVIGGSLNGRGSITVKVAATGEAGYLGQVMRLVSDAQQEKSRSETLSDQVARLLFYVAAFAGVAAFVFWLSETGDMNLALERMVTVLVIACPHALGLAIPLVAARSISLGARHGLLVRRRAALESAARVNVVLMDKTGTLTEGRFKVTTIRSFVPEYGENDVLALVAALERHSNHPLSAGVLREADGRGLAVPAADDVVTLPGAGLKGRVDGKNAMVASVAYVRKQGIPLDEGVLDEAGPGSSASVLLIGDKPIGLVAQGDRVRDESAAMVRSLDEMDIAPVILTGDNREAAEAVARSLGIADVAADLMPEDKVDIIQSYKNRGFVTMMVGDGVNDAPSLARADVGVAIGAGTDVAMDSADIVLVRSNPADIPGIVRLAKNTASKMKQNLWWGAGYNIVAIPLAAGVLAHWGVVLSPAMGAVLMSLSTVIVAANAMTLRMDSDQVGGV